MRTSAFLPALLIAASASAQSASFTLQLTSENGGADTRATWNYTGTPIISPTELNPQGISIYGLVFASGSYTGGNVTIGGTSGMAFTDSIASVTDLSTGLTLTNTTTANYATVTKADFFFEGPISGISLAFNISTINADPGQSIVLSGPTSGHFLIGAAYSNFNEGTWTLDQAVYTNFDTVLIVGPGTPIPEPSTYGLILGGLALAGAAIRRRKISK